MNPNSELLQRAQELHEESQALEERIKFIDQQANELSESLQNVRFLEKHPQSTGLASLGKGLFIESSFATQTFFVDIGAGVFVKKQASDIITIIGEQLKGLQTLRTETRYRLAQLAESFSLLLEQAEHSA